MIPPFVLRAALRALSTRIDVIANNLAVNGAELTERRGFFVGTNLFFYVPGHTLDMPSTVKFEIPDNWRVATGMKRGEGKNVFQVRNFDNLVDCPVVLSDFDDFQTGKDLSSWEAADILPFGGMLEPLRLDAGAQVLVTFVPPFPIYPPETAWMREPKTEIPGLILNARSDGGRDEPE